MIKFFLSLFKYYGLRNNTSDVILYIPCRVSLIMFWMWKFLWYHLAVMFCIYMFKRETCPFLSRWVLKLWETGRQNCQKHIAAANSDVKAKKNSDFRAIFVAQIWYLLDNFLLVFFVFVFLAGTLFVQMSSLLTAAIHWTRQKQSKSYKRGKRYLALWCICIRINSWGWQPLKIILF